MIAFLIPVTPSAVVDRIEDDAIAVLEVPCLERTRRHPTRPPGASSRMGRRGDIPPPQRLPPRPRTYEHRDRSLAFTPDGEARIAPAPRAFIDVPLSRLPAGVREGDFVPLAALPLPPSDVCSGNLPPHGAGGGPASRPDTTRALALPGMP